ncbi:MAG: hypothetical protein WA790_02230 [Sulfitobacter sp.]
MQTSTPQTWAVDMAIARRFSQTGKPEKARDILRNIQRDAPTQWQGLIYLAHAELDCDDAPVALALRNIAEQEKASKTALAQFDIHHALNCGETAHAIDLAKTALTQELALDFPTLLMIGDHCVEQGFANAALLFADHAMNRGCDVIRVYRIKYAAILMAASDETLEAELCASIFKDGASENHAVGLTLLSTDRADNFDVLKRLLAQAELKWPNSKIISNIQKALDTIDR